MSAAETYAHWLIEPYNDHEQAIFLYLWKTRGLEMIDILNIHFYVKDAAKIHFVLDAVKRLNAIGGNISYMDVCQILK